MTYLLSVRLPTALGRRLDAEAGSNKSEFVRAALESALAPVADRYDPVEALSVLPRAALKRRPLRMRRRL
ncbi:MAG: hypothetical protein J0L84_17735 [Verrucomicrobia bacterium]|nr:hypothetical protein [Verrucomicrobiota bacterium]